MAATGDRSAAVSGGDAFIAALSDCLRRRDRPRGARPAIEQLGREEVVGSRAQRRHRSTARCLVAVHAMIGVGEERLIGGAIGGEDRSASARGELEQLAAPHFELDIHHTLLELATLEVRRVARAVGEHDDELVPA